MIYDIHTHNRKAKNAVINIAPGDEMDPDGVYSVGIHPWKSGEDFDAALLEKTAALPQVVAIGETGIDGLTDVPLQRQREVFEEHVRLSEKYGKPLILHVVKRYDDIIRLHRELKPSQMWILHGFRGKPQLAEQLLREGFAFSIGERFNPESVALIPDERLFIETDESSLPIEEIAARVGKPLRELKF